jgi:hypothetical protein
MLRRLYNFEAFARRSDGIIASDKKSVVMFVFVEKLIFISIYDTIYLFLGENIFLLLD